MFKELAADKNSLKSAEIHFEIVSVAIITLVALLWRVPKIEEQRICCRTIKYSPCC